ncbi:MAG: TolC family protein [Wenzhouxiangella sp.]
MMGFIATRGGFAALLMASALWLVSPPSQAQAVALDLRAAHERLQDRNERLAAARQGIDRAEFQRQAADAARLPVVEIDGSLTRLNDPLAIDLTSVRQRVNQVFPGDLPPGLIPSGIPVQDQTFTNLAVQAVQPIYLGGRIDAGRSAARAGVAAELAVVDRLQGDLMVELVQRYFGQVVASEALAVRQQSVDSLRQLAFNARRLEEEGEISRAERLRADVALIEAEGELSTAREQLNLAGAALATLLASERAITTVTPIPGPPRRYESADWRARAVQNNPAVLELNARLDQAGAAVSAERGALKPSLVLVGRRELYTNDLTLIEPEWAISLRASWRFFDGGLRQSRASAAEARVMELEWLRSSLERQIGLLVDQQIQAQHTALERHVTFSAAAELAEESVRVQRRAFEEGFATSLEVIEAELARSRVALAGVLARYEAWVATAALHAAAGEPTALIDRIEETPRD